MNSADWHVPRLPANKDLTRSQLFAFTKGKFDSINSGVDFFAPSSRKPDSIIDDKYQIVSFVGRGGMGEVYQARHLMLNKVVALKTFTSSTIDNSARLRFQREAQAIAKLNHTNIIQIFDFGLAENSVPYYTMEFLHGLSLDEMLEQNGPLPATVVLEYFIQAAQGLAAAHRKGIVHRDLKPGNLFIENTAGNTSSKGTIRIVDFGTASLIQNTTAVQSLTATGTIFGTPLYVSPEQAMGKTVTAQADIYSLGCTMFEMLTGSPPFAGETAIETVGLHLEAVPPTLMRASDGAEFPIKLERTVARMLAKSPGDRQSSMEQVVRDLEAIKLMLEKSSVSNYSPAQEWEDELESDPDDFADCDFTDQENEETEDFEQDEQTVNSEHPLRERSATWTFAVAAGSILVGIILGCAWIYLANSLAQGETISDSHPVITQPQTIADVQLSQNLMDDGKHFYRILKFRQGEDFGTFTNASNQKIPARDKIAFDPLSAFSFTPSQRFLLNPANFQVLKPLNCLTVKLRDIHSNNQLAACLEEIGKLSNLKGLTLSSCEFKNDNFSSLSALKSLLVLCIDTPDLDASALARTSLPKQLLGLSLNSPQNIDPLLETLKGNPQLRNLYLDGIVLYRSQIEAISQYKTLKCLQISESCIQDSDMQTLTKLTSLEVLDLQHCHLSGKSIPAIRTMAKRKLKSIMISPQGFTKQELTEIKKLVPDCHFEANPLERVGAPDLPEIEKSFYKF